MGVKGGKGREHLYWKLSLLTPKEKTGSLQGYKCVGRGGTGKGGGGGRKWGGGEVGSLEFLVCRVKDLVKIRGGGG